MFMDVVMGRQGCLEIPSFPNPMPWHAACQLLEVGMSWCHVCRLLLCVSLFGRYDFGNIVFDFLLS
jgi:hypothetical protein